MRTVIFDLDGTLADTSGDLLAAANSCFRDLGLGDLLVRGRDDGIAHRGGRAMLRAGFARVEGFGEDEVDRQYWNLLEAYDRAIDHHTVFYPGAREAVGALMAAGYGVGICTNKPEALAEKLMRNLKFRDEFAALLGSDSLAVRKPDPEHFNETVRRVGGDPKRACLIGDTQTDHDTARNAGVPSVLVSFGPNGHTVRDLKPDAILDHFDGLFDLVERLEL
jgi:phosphoglycolate phosphatase